MKKFLLTTSALVGAAAIAGSAFAAGPEVTVGGFIDFQASQTDQDDQFAVSAGSDVDNSQSTHFVNDTEVHINVDGKADNGLGYGAVIELEADVDAGNTDDGSSSGNADKTYLYVESSAGRVEAGNNVGSAQSLNVGAENIARATGGIKGDFHRYVNVGQDAAIASAYTAANILFVPALASEYTKSTTSGTQTGTDLADNEEATKLTYFTPRISGFQAGASYTPDSGDAGSAAALSGTNGADQYHNLYSAGINYEGDFDGVGVRVGVVGEQGTSETQPSNNSSGSKDIESWATGAEVSYRGFTVAGSYGDNGESRQVDAGGSAASPDADYWTAGAAYETGPFGVSVTYFDSTTEDSAGVEDTFENLVIGADYALAPGLTPYVEAALFEASEGGVSTGTNEGTVVLVGTQLNF